MPPTTGEISGGVDDENWEDVGETDEGVGEMDGGVGGMEMEAIL